MVSIKTLLAALDERQIAREVGLPRDEARNSFRLQRNTVETFREFEDILADYMSHDFSCCVAKGASLRRCDALGEAKRLIENQYRRRGGNIVTAFNDAQQGTHMGVRGLLDMLCEAKKAIALEDYVRDCFDRHVAPNAWAEKVELMRQFLQAVGPILDKSIDINDPERYAADYTDLVRGYTDSLEQTSSMFRRL
jgi:hypothetical protein